MIRTVPDNSDLKYNTLTILVANRPTVERQKPPKAMHSRTDPRPLKMNENIIKAIAPESHLQGEGKSTS